MSKKKKHKKKKKKELSKSSYDFCNHPLHVKVGNHKVVCIGYSDFDPIADFNTFQKLDAFIGLSFGWERHEATKKQFLSPFLQTVYEKYMKATVLKSIIHLPIENMEVNLDVFHIAKSLLKANKKIGFGCMAGHGRTGWLLSKLIQHFEKCSGDEAVERCRERFCKKCVESSAQIEDLGCVSVKESYTAFSFGDVSKWESQFAQPIPYTEKPEKSIIKGTETTPVSADEISDELWAIYRKEQEGEKLTPEEQKMLDDDLGKLIACDMKNAEDSK